MENTTFSIVADCLDLFESFSLRSSLAKVVDALVCILDSMSVGNILAVWVGSAGHQISRRFIVTESQPLPLGSVPGILIISYHDNHVCGRDGNVHILSGLPDACFVFRNAHRAVHSNWRLMHFWHPVTLLHSFHIFA